MFFTKGAMRLMQKKKTCKAVLLIFIQMIFLVGCWDTADIDKAYFPFAIAIDSNPEEGSFKFSYLAPSVAREVGEETVILKGMARSLGEAQQNVQYKFHHRFSLGQTQVLIIQEEVARANPISSFLDYFGRSPKTKEYMNLVICKQPGEQAFDMHLQSTPYPSTIINEGINRNFPNMKVPSRTMRTFFNALSQEGIEPSLPYLMLEISEGTPIGIILEQVAVFYQDQMIGILDARESLGFMILRSAGENKQFTISHHGMHDERHRENTSGFSTIRIQNVSTKIRSFIEKDEPGFHITVDLEGDIVEHEPQEEVKLLEKNHIQLLEASYEREIQKLLKETLYQLQKQYRSDIVGFGHILRAQNPAYFDEETWRDIFEEIEIDMDVNVSIRSIGVIL